RCLDASTMCRAAQVRKNWRNYVDGNGFTWKKCLLEDGFNLEKSAEEHAISENWNIQNSISSPSLPCSTNHP
ncbi:22010_t:CDS:1, partial [Entrophospora sp. SA101]